MSLASFSPTPGYPSLDLHRYGYLSRAVQDYVHPFDHRLLQPDLCGGCLLCVALNDHLVMADEDRHGSGTLASALPQQGQRQLQTVGSGTLDRGVEAVGYLSGVHAAPANKRSGFYVATLPRPPFVIVPVLESGVGIEETSAVDGGLLQVHMHSVALEGVRPKPLCSHPVEQPEVD